jgi:hypothetical protein
MQIRRVLMIRRTKLALVGALALTAAGGTAFAQWPTDPAAPLVLADLTGPQVQPKIAVIPTGGFYVSWFDSSTGGYDVTLQRLDAAGTEQWPHNGVLVADRGFSSTQDYGLSVDTAGNALLAFRDDRGATTEITVSKIGPDGTLLWGSGGVQVSSGGAFVAAPRVTGASDGGTVVAWTSDSTVMAQKLDPAGAPQWGAGVTLSPSSGSFAAADIHAADNGTAIVSFIHQTGSFGSPIHLWAQKLTSADGALLWGTGHVQVYDAAGGSLQFGNFPAFVPDQAGGAVFAWYTSTPTLQCRAQRVLANGTEAFPHQGVEVSTNAARIRVSPSAAFNASTQEVVVAWREQTSNQSQSGLYAQKLDASGARQWTDNGAELVALSSDEITDVTALVVGGGAIVAWVQSPSFGNDPIYAVGVDGDGAPVWAPTIVDLCNLATQSSDLAGVIAPEGFAAYVWSDGDSSTGDIAAAALDGDGSLGAGGSVFRDGFESGDTGGWSQTVP